MSITKDRIQEILQEIDLSEVKDADNLRRAAFTNKDLLCRLQKKYPGVWKTCKELVYWSLHYKEPDFIENQFCKCGNRKAFNMDLFRYRDFCSVKCNRVFSEEKIKETNRRKYGTDYASQNKEILQKQLNTFKERYGAATPMEVQEFKEKAKQTNLEKYGHEYVGQAQRNKIEKTFRDKYGVNSPNQIKEVQEKIKQTNLEKYGSEVYLSSECAKKRISETNLEKYGSKNVFGSEEIQEKIKQTNLEKYGVKHIGSRSNYSLFENRQHMKNIQDMNREFILEHFLENGELNFEKIQSYFNIGTNSAYVLRRDLNLNFPVKQNKLKTQKDIHKILSISGKALKFNDKSLLYPKELDIYCPEMQIAIEYDGMMYHSFGKSEWGVVNNSIRELYDKDKHLEKTLLCEERGIHLFHIFENEWIDPIKQEIWKSMLLNALGCSERVYARKCELKRVSTDEKTKFLEENHIQGSCASSVNLGLYYQNELISLMTFGKSRFNKNYEYELIRFCNKKNTSVIGGAGKLLAHFIKEFHPTSIISYANRRWSQGKLYEKLGFEKVGETKPNYFYFKDEDKLYNRIHFQKHKLSRLLEKYDPDLSETENMYSNGYRKIYDSGNLIYCWKTSNNLG